MFGNPDQRRCVTKIT